MEVLLKCIMKYLPYGEKVMAELKSRNIRAELDGRNEKLGYKIREARLEKVPYMLIVGEKEQENGTVTVRCRDAEDGKQDLGEMGVEEFVNRM